MARLGGGVRVGGGGGAWRFVATVDRRIPSPTLTTCRRRGVRGSGVTWDTATLLFPPVIVSRRAVCVLGWRRGVGRSAFWQTAVLGFPTA